LKLALATGANLDVPALYLHVATTAIEHNPVRRRDDDVSRRALQVDCFLRGQREGIALCFGAHIARWQRAASGPRPARRVACLWLRPV
jgi:hypothetical protein